MAYIGRIRLPLAEYHIWFILVYCHSYWQNMQPIKSVLPFCSALPIQYTPFFAPPPYLLDSGASAEFAHSAGCAAAVYCFLLPRRASPWSRLRYLFIDLYRKHTDFLFLFMFIIFYVKPYSPSQNDTLLFSRTVCILFFLSTVRFATPHWPRPSSPAVS